MQRANETLKIYIERIVSVGDLFDLEVTEQLVISILAAGVKPDVRNKVFYNDYPNNLSELGTLMKKYDLH